MDKNKAHSVGTDTDDLRSVWTDTDWPAQPSANRQMAMLDISDENPLNTGYLDENNGVDRSFSRPPNGSCVSSSGPSLTSSNTGSILSTKHYETHQKLDSRQTPKYEGVDDATDLHRTLANEPKSNSKERHRNPHRSSLYSQVKMRKDTCFRCGKKVYPMEKIGPFKDVFYHRGCCSCIMCDVGLNTNSVFLNRDDLYDLNIYCKKHQPNIELLQQTIRSKKIQSALKAPKLDFLNPQIRGGNQHGSSSKSYSRSSPFIMATDTPTQHERLRRGSLPNALYASASPGAHALEYANQHLRPENMLRRRSWCNGETKQTPPLDVARQDELVPGSDLDSGSVLKTVTITESDF